MVYGLISIVYGLSSMVNGLSSKVYCLSSMVYGLSFMVLLFLGGLRVGSCTAMRLQSSWRPRAVFEILSVVVALGFLCGFRRRLSEARSTRMCFLVLCGFLLLAVAVKHESRLIPKVSESRLGQCLVKHRVVPQRPFLRHVTALFPTPSPPRTGAYLGDLHVYDPAAMAWTNLSAAASGTPPFARSGHGFASAGGLLFVHGGFNSSGAIVLSCLRV